MHKLQQAYVVLLRGINVGGKNSVPMARLRQCLEEAGFSDVMTYIASGNVLLRSALPVAKIRARIEKLLPEHFQLDSERIKVLVLSRAQLQAVVAGRPTGFGDQPQLYHSDAIFLMDGDVPDIMHVFDPREGVDAVWPGVGMVYSQRLSADRTKSRLSKIVVSPLYASMTIRSWATTTKLLELLTALDTRDAKTTK